MPYHERERKNNENAKFFHIVYLFAKLYNIFDEAFFIDVSIGRYFLGVDTKRERQRDRERENNVLSTIHNGW